MTRPIILIVKTRPQVGAVFPDGVPPGVEVFSERQPLDGLRARVVILAGGLSERTVAAAYEIARSVGGSVAELKP